MNVLIAGCGYIGIRVADQLLAEGHSVNGLRRSPDASASKIDWIEGDLVQKKMSDTACSIDTLILAAGLRRDTEKNYEALFDHGYAWLIQNLLTEGHPLKRIVMVSTTSVFAETQGNWVDESSPVDQEKSPAKYYLAAEAHLQASGVSSSVLRLSGIYGPDRIRLIREVAEGRAFRRPGPPHYLNHIHADDAARAVVHLTHLENPAPVYIGSDRDPADRSDVLQWISDQLDRGTLREADAKEATTRRGGNKRCRSDVLVNSGFTFQYPTFREGYQALLP